MLARCQPLIGVVISLETVASKEPIRLLPRDRDQEFFTSMGRLLRKIFCWGPSKCSHPYRRSVIQQALPEQVFQLSGDFYFIVFGYDVSEQKKWESYIRAHHGKLWTSSCTKMHHIYILCCYFCTKLFPWHLKKYKKLRLARDKCEFVSEFWIQKVVELKRWLQIEDIPYYRPPIAWLTSTEQVQHLQCSFSNLQDQVDREVENDEFSKALCGCCSCVSHSLKKSSESESSRLRLPFSPKNVWKGTVPIWPFIATIMKCTIHDSRELISILMLFSSIPNKESFNCLYVTLETMLTAEEKQIFFETVLPQMMVHIYEMPLVFRPDSHFGPRRLLSIPQNEVPFPLFTQHAHMTKRQILSLLCASFFSLFHSHSSWQESDGQQYNVFDMTSLYGGGAVVNTLKCQKLLCVLHYFIKNLSLATDTTSLDEQIISYSRVSLSSADKKTVQQHDCIHTRAMLRLHRIKNMQVDVEDNSPLVLVRTEETKLIEDLDRDHIQIDFANKFAGGAVFGSSCVQEEIRFIISPELLVSTLLFAKLDAHEAFAVHGTERYSRYTGYSHSFRYQGNYQDSSAFEVVGTDTSNPDFIYIRRKSVVVGIDACPYPREQMAVQMRRDNVLREITKACAGFIYPHKICMDWNVATGNWGCGVFGGNMELKFLVQWLSASLCHRNLTYVLFTKSDQDLKKSIMSLTESDGVSSKEITLVRNLIDALSLLSGQDEKNLARVSMLKLLMGKKK